MQYKCRTRSLRKSNIKWLIRYEILKFSRAIIKSIAVYSKKATFLACSYVAQMCVLSCE